MQENIYDIIKNARKTQKMTLKKLSEGSGVSIGHLSEAERGNTTLGGEKLISVCRILGIDLNQEGESSVKTSPKPEVVILGSNITSSFPIEDSKLRVVVDEWPALPDSVKRKIVSLVMASEPDDTTHQLVDAVGTQVHGTATEKRVGFKSKKKSALYTQLADPPDLKTQPAPRVANG